MPKDCSSGYTIWDESLFLVYEETILVLNDFYAFNVFDWGSIGHIMMLVTRFYVSLIGYARDHDSIYVSLT